MYIFSNVLFVFPGIFLIKKKKKKKRNALNIIFAFFFRLNIRDRGFKLNEDKTLSMKMWIVDFVYQVTSD